jgi:histidinol-phosphate phosphatase family protein
MTDLGGITAYVLAGGLGTRLRESVPDRPKALAEVLGRPYIYHLLDQLAEAGLRRVVLCTGHLGRMLEDAVGARYRGLEIAHSREEAPLGTGGALALAFSRHPSELALCLNGDSFAECDLAAYARWFETRAEAGALLLARVDDAGRYGRVDVDGAGKVAGFEEKGGGGPGGVSAGVYLLRPRALAGLTPGEAASLERDVFPRLARQGDLCAWAGCARFLDIGTPESFAAAGRFLLEGDAPAASVSASVSGAAVFLDRDGTVIADKHYLHDPAGVELLPGAAEGLLRLQALGLPLALVTNQSGVGRGYFGRGDAERVNGRLIELLAARGVRLRAVYTCPHAPEDGCACRKPRPGLIARAAAEMGVDPAQSFVLGDKPCDVDLGLGVGATAFLVTTGYGAGHAGQAGCRPQHVAASLDEASGVVADILSARAAS